MTRTKLDPKGQKINDFVNDLFETEFRNTLTAKITAAVAKDPKIALLIDDREWNQLMGWWMRGWKGVQDGACPPSDLAILSFLKTFITTNKLSMFVPKLETVNASNGGKFKLTGYDKKDMTQPASADLFLQLLGAGAHFVVIHFANDTKKTGKTVQNFFTTLSAKFPDMKAPAGHSHYAAVVSLRNSLVYPGTIPAPQDGVLYPTIVSFLTGTTAHAGSNTFFQLEGWPLFSLASAINYFSNDPNKLRHMADFATHQATKWNISTFGASAYSEKRGTTVFLAPDNWDPQPTAGTMMPPYEGAGTPQKWLQTSLIQI